MVVPFKPNRYIHNHFSRNDYTVREKTKGTLILTPDDILTVPASKVDISPTEWASINPTQLSLSEYTTPTDQFVDKVARNLMVNPGNFAPGFARLITPWTKIAPSSAGTQTHYVNARLYITLLQQALTEKWPHYFAGKRNTGHNQLINDKSILGAIGKHTSKSPHFDQYGLTTSVGIVSGPNQAIAGGSMVIVDAATLRQNHGLTQGHIGWAFNQNNHEYYSTPTTGDKAHLTQKDIRQQVKAHTLVLWDSVHPTIKKPCITPVFTNNRGMDQDFLIGRMGRMHGATKVTPLSLHAQRQFYRVWGGLRSR